MKTRPDIGSRVREILVQALELEVRPGKIDDHDVIFEGELDADSIASLELLTSLEDEFGFLFDDDEISADLFVSVGALIEAVEGKLTGGNERRKETHEENQIGQARETGTIGR